MTAAPQFGVCIFVGVKSGKTYSIDTYFSDVAAAMCNFDSGAGAAAGSQDFWEPPEPVILQDFAIHTGMTDTTRVRLAHGGKPTGHMFRFAIHLDTSVARPKFRIGLTKRIGLVQLA